MSPSMAMATIYEKDLPSLEEYLDHFSLIGSQVGAVFMINSSRARAVQRKLEPELVRVLDD